MKASLHKISHIITRRGSVRRGWRARNLTRVWVVYFAAIVLISLILAMTASLELWSLFANVLSYVFAILLVLAQYAYRAWRYRAHGLFMPWDTLRLIARISPRDRAQWLFHGRSGPL